MLPHPPSAPQSAQRAASPPTAPVRVGVGIDTARYGHYAAFLRDDLQPAAGELRFTESAAGYAQLRQRLELIAQRHGPVHFLIRLDAAGPYADNLLHFLHGLAQAAPTGAQTPADPTVSAQAWPLVITLSVGDPQRNKNYRVAFFGNRKSDPVEARAAARYALREWPAATPRLSAQQRTLRQAAARLHAACRQRTRLLNQLHHLLALAFPELGLLIGDISAGWVLELVHRFPTARLLAAASESQLGDIPYLPERHIPALLEQARTSIASLQGPLIEELLRDQVRQLRDVHARQKRLEKLVVSAYRALPQANHLETIPGIGAVTAAVLTACIVDIDRFRSPGHLVAYFGTLPIEVASGVDRDGQPRGPKRYIMSRRGNDLVRRYLWMAGLSAVRCNPAVRALYARVVARHPDQKAIAIGHAMRKLLHLVFAIWKTDRPFNANHYPWQAPAQGDARARRALDHAGPPEAAAQAGSEPSTPGLSEGAQRPKTQATGLRDPDVPDRQEVTAAWVVPPGAEEGLPGDSCFIDFAHLKRQLPLARVLDQLGLAGRLRGQGPQRRCACPIHRGDNRGQSFSVHLGDGVFCCHDPSCNKKGDIIDLWAAVHGLSLRAAAEDLVRTFHLEPAP